MNLALYGMFLAIIIPPAKKDKFIAGIVVLSMFASFLCSVLLVSLSEGFRIILLTILIAGIAAWLHPVQEQGESSHES